MKNKLKLLAASVAAFAVTASAHAAENEYITQINDALDSVKAIWAVVAVMIIGVGLVTVGVRFMKKVK